MNAAHRLGLGTVQWGLDYGIANVAGRPADTEVIAMLEMADAAGIDTLDTAHAYGEAQAVLGRLKTRRRSFRIVTKTAVPPHGADGAAAAAAAVRGFADSLAVLGEKAVYALMAHRGDTLLEADGHLLWAAMEAERTAGRVERIGVSVYAPEELAAILECYEPDIVQLPYNIYDQRFALSGLLDRLVSRGVEVHTRSAFLQGVLAMSAAALPPHFASIAEHQRRLHAAAAAAGYTPVQAALAFCLGDARIARVIVGCETATQLEGILSAAAVKSETPINFGAFALSDECIILPTHWPR